MNYLVMNEKTAECDVFGSEKYAKKIATTDCFVFPIDFVEERDEAELLLYPNANKTAILPWVAEYKEDIINDDLKKATINNPVKIMRGDIHY